jgi:hypothetical protein
LDLDGGQVQPPRWDVADIRSMGDAFIEASFLPDDPLRSAIERARQSGVAFGASEYTDDQLVEICDSRAAIRRARRRLERSLTQLGRIGPPGPECARTPESRGSAFEYFWRSRDSRFATHIAQLPVARAPRVLVHGHTHLAAAPVAMGRAPTAPVLVNAGAWQRTLTPFQADEVMTDRGWSEAELLSRLQPADLAGCYGVVWIEPYAGDPEPALRFWRADGGWGRLPRDAAGIETACGGRGP